MPHAWCNSSDTPIRMLVIFSPGQIEGLFRTAAGVDDVDKITAIAARYGTKLVGPPLHGTVHSIHSPQPKGWPTLMLRGDGDAGLPAARPACEPDREANTVCFADVTWPDAPTGASG